MYIVHFMLAILLTALSYFSGSMLVTDGLMVWQALLIGAVVVSLGALAEKWRAPMWLIILIPFPVGMGLLFFLLNEFLVTWITTYFITLLMYTLIHSVFSFFFKFHSLIPAWKLS
ncbi:hypothetical protein [Shouchella hunanensis]|uniref:Uncharacterized protein n=1 Tax=Shouchella hunanensis TaxID=766894 RepID=A0ABY7W9I9_9BACI|nr:hypothetical protein [Shouchella hunanensis]WDF05587.1 hypothetical protein PQ477_09200 [Shouchella hunanensis]